MRLCRRTARRPTPLRRIGAFACHTTSVIRRRFRWARPTVTLSPVFLRRDALLWTRRRLPTSATQLNYAHTHGPSIFARASSLTVRRTKKERKPLLRPLRRRLSGGVGRLPSYGLPRTRADESSDFAKACASTPPCGGTGNHRLRGGHFASNEPRTQSEGLSRERGSSPPLGLLEHPGRDRHSRYGLGVFHNDHATAEAPFFCRPAKGDTV